MLAALPFVRKRLALEPYKGFAQLLKKQWLQNSFFCLAKKAKQKKPRQKTKTLAVLLLDRNLDSLRDEGHLFSRSNYDKPSPPLTRPLAQIQYIMRDQNIKYYSYYIYADK